MSLVNKESALGLLQCRIGQGGNSKQIEERVGGVRRHHEAAGETDAGT